MSNAVRRAEEPSRTAESVFGRASLPDSERLVAATERLRAAVEHGDAQAMILGMDEAIGSGCLAVTHPQAWSGTAIAAEAHSFVRTFIEALEVLDGADLDPLADRRFARVIQAALAACGRGALLLSGGGTLGNYHVGVIRALMEAGLLPPIISGSSAGALMAGIVGTRSDAEIAALFADGAPSLAFDKPDDLTGAARLIDGQTLASFVERLIPDMTFAEARAISGRDINIVVAARREEDGGLVLSADSTPDVLVRDAVMASCAVPFLFAPVQLRMRDSAGVVRQFRPGMRWIDGSIWADLPIAWLKETYGIDRSVASMVNPAVLPFFSDHSLDSSPLHAASSLSVRWMRSLLDFGIMLSLPMLRFCEPPTKPKLSSMLEVMSRVNAQSYRAHITITPKQRLHDPRSLLAPADAEQMRDYVSEGERAAHGRLEVLRTALGIEQALARITR